MTNWLAFNYVLRKVIGPKISQIIDEYPYIPIILLILVWAIVAAIQIRKRKSKAKAIPKPKKKQAPAGGYTNFKGEVWYPDGRKWNNTTKQWEISDYTDSPEPADE